MGLKTIHLLLMATCILAAIGFGLWGVMDYAESGKAMHRWLGIGSFAGAVVLSVYTVWFFRKLKDVGYL